MIMGRSLSDVTRFNSSASKDEVKKAATDVPDEREWNFHPVDDDEIELCFLYEFGRERAKSSPSWLKLAQAFSKRPRIELARRIARNFGRVNLHWFLNPQFLRTAWRMHDQTLRRKEAKEFMESRTGAQTFRQCISLSITLQRDLHEYADAGATDFDS